MTDINKLMQFSQIRIDEDIHEKLNNKINQLLEWVKCLDEVDTKRIEPMFSVNDYFGNVLENLREDIPNTVSLQKEILQNTPDKEDVFICVPKVIK